MLREIFGLLPTKDRVAAAAACRAWRDFSRSPDAGVWGVLSMPPPPRVCGEREKRRAFPSDARLG